LKIGLHLKHTYSIQCNNVTFLKKLAAKYISPSIVYTYPVVSFVYLLICVIAGHHRRRRH